MCIMITANFPYQFDTKEHKVHKGNNFLGITFSTEKCCIEILLVVAPLGKNETKVF